MSNDNNSPNLDAVLAHLADVVDSRRADLAAGKVDPKSSYIAQLFSKGDDAILKKIGEEATEAVMAAKDSRNANLASEQQALRSRDGGKRQPQCQFSFGATSPPKP